MKLHFSPISLGVALAYALAFPLHAVAAEESHDHEHEASGCTGDHDHEHEGHDHEHEGHDHEHEGHDHEHEASGCTGDHDHEHEDHEHEHEASGCTGDHDHEHEGHDHEHEASGCTGDHDHEHEGHDHEQESSGCTGDHDHEHEGHDHEHEASGCSGHDHSHDGHDEGPVIVTVDAHARSVLNMKVETVPEAGRALVGSVYGFLASPDHAVETYSLPCEGRITLHVKSAQSVHQGDLLYTLQSPAIATALADKGKAEAVLTSCEREAEALRKRVETLKSIGSPSSELEVQLLAKESEVAQARQDLQNAEAQLLQLTYVGDLETRGGVPVLTVKAEKNGTVRNVGVSQGSWGGQGSPVVTMSDPEAMEVVASLYAAAVPAFTEVKATLSTATGEVDLRGGWRLAEQVDAERQTRSLYFTPEKLPEGARAGQLCRLDFYGGATKDAKTVSIPDSSIIKVGLDDVVFLELEPGRYAMVKVHAGESRCGKTPVTGLVPGQRIVTEGGYELKYILPAQGGTQKKAGHFHADGKFHEGEDH